MSARAVIHCHFYQPPREEPWLELVPRETSAAPWHDWNSRITDECYAPLAAAAVLDEGGAILGVRNAYAHLAFDVGPTLFRWLDQHAPHVAEAIVAADRDARQRTGHGAALAAPYHHVILPLASRREKVTEVQWGIRDFARRFGREPLGMWLPETAVDDETLVVLAEAGIRYTVLAPHQVDASDTPAPVRRWRRGDHELTLFVYDGPVSHDIAFTSLMRDTEAWANRLHRPGAFVAMATDGETFGHHHRRGVTDLARLIAHAERTGLTLTTFDALVHEADAVETQLVAPTSWSCAHGIERWRSDCGCRMDPATSQAWRGPLRSGLDRLRDRIDEVIAREWPADAGDLHEVALAAGPDLDNVTSLAPEACRLLEARRHALAMFTSCGWFFDDLGRIEPRLILRHAARALDFIPAGDASGLRDELLATLATAVSNDATKGNGADIWRRDVMREADGPARLAAGIAALREFAPDALDDLHLPSHRWRLEDDDVVTIHRRTGRELRWSVVPVVEGLVATHVHVRSRDDGTERIVESLHFPPPVLELLEPAVLALMAEATGTAETGDPAAFRHALLEAAWTIAARDGLDDAGVLVHGAIDGWHTGAHALPMDARVDASVRLRAFPAGRARAALARRFGVAESALG